MGRSVITFLAALLAIAFLSQSFVPNLDEQKPSVRIYILQNGKRMEAKDNVIKIKPEPFQFIFEFTNSNQVLFSAAFQDAAWKQSKKVKYFEEMESFYDGKCFPDYLLNPNKRMNIASDGYSSWYYRDDETHRFDSCVVVGDKLVCSRTIDNFLLVDSKETSLLDGTGNGLSKVYLVFVLYSYANGESLDLQRTRFIIDWE